MRAEGQAHIDRIEAALALVRRSLDWDRAVRRLDELNARVEDPTLWDDPKRAEEVMRERRRLESAIGTVNEITSEMADAIEYIELGEAEGDDAVVSDGLATLQRFSSEACRDKFAVASATPAVVRAYDVDLVRDGKSTGYTKRTSYVIGQDGRVKFVHSDMDYKDHVRLTLDAVRALRAKRKG